MELLVGPLPGVHGVAGEAGEGLVFIVGGVAVLRRVAHELAEVVGAVVGEVEEEGPVFVLLDELDAFAGPEVGGVLGLDVDLAVFDDLLVVELLRAAVGLGDPGGEAFAGGHVGAEVPFAAEAAGVAGVAEDLAEGGKFLEGVVGLGADHVLGIEEGMDAVLGGDEAGEKGGAGGRADGIAAEGAGEADALGSHLVEVRCADVGIAVAAEGPGALIVGEDEDDIDRLCVGEGRCEKGQQQEEQGTGRHGMRKRPGMGELAISGEVNMPEW